jgi:filamentous hemagglutinin
VAGCAAGAAGAGASGSGTSGGSGCGAGALGAVTGELAAGFYNSGREAAGLPPKTDTIQFASMVSGIAAAVAGQGAQGVAIAASTGANAAENNRMLHALEEKWLKDQAKVFAQQEHISEETALKRLTQQALKQVDYLWRAQLADGDDVTAKVFLVSNKQSFTNDLGEQQKLFTASGQQVFRPEMFADTADPAFYKQFAQPGISRSLNAGLAKELKDSGISLKNGAADLLKAAKDHPGIVLDGLWSGVKGLPQAVKDGFNETGHAIGEGSATAFNADISAKLNAIYGTDVSGYQQAMLAIRTFSALSGAAGAAKLGGGLSEAAAKAVGKKLDAVLDQKASEVLLKSGGAYDKTGQPLLDLKQLTTEQKGVVGDVFGQNTVKQIVPDGQKLARIPGVGETGIDDLYKVNRPDVDYVVIEYKFVGDYKKAGSSSLGNTADGRQGADSWIMGSDRLEKSVGREIAPEIRRSVDTGRTETWVVTTRPDGSTEVQVLDTLGRPKLIDTSKILLPKTNLSEAKP